MIYGLSDQPNAADAARAASSQAGLSLGTQLEQGAIVALVLGTTAGLLALVVARLWPDLRPVRTAQALVAGGVAWHLAGALLLLVQGAWRLDVAIQEIGGLLPWVVYCLLFWLIASAIDTQRELRSIRTMSRHARHHFGPAVPNGTRAATRQGRTDASGTHA